MFNWFAKLLLTSTAIAPVLLTYAWLAYQAGEQYLVAVILGVQIVLIAVCVFLLRYAKTHLERLNFTTTSIEAADRENTAFLLLYLSPLFTSSFASINWQIWIPTLIIFAGVVATGYSYHFNPLLGLMGWHFYKVGTPEGVTYVLITKRQLRSVAGTIEVGQLTEYIVMDVGG